MSPDALLAALPSMLRAELVACYTGICRNYRENRWEPSELNGGKFAEVVYTIVRGALDGRFPSRAAKPRNMAAACRALEEYPKDANRVGDRSLRVLVPRMLPVLYEVRNNRGVGHVGGDVDPNHGDAEAVLAMARWVMAELVRIFHGLAITEAQEAVETIVSRQHPLVWVLEGKRRVLDTSLRIRDQILLLLYAEPGWVSTANLCEWTEYSNLSTFRKSVLAKLHSERLIEHDQRAKRAQISPKGVQFVEDRLLEAH